MTTPVGYEGEPLTLTDGRTVHVQYRMRGIVLLEKRFGSLAALQTAISTDGTGAVYEPGLRFVSAGLLHEAGTPTGLLSDPDVLADYLRPEQFQDAITAAGKALTAAFPGAAQDAAAKETADAPSRGTTGTTSGPSSSDAPTASSG